MVVAGWIGYANPHDDVAEDGRIGKRNARSPKIVGRMKCELINAGLETGSREERDVGATVDVGRERGDLPAFTALHEMKLDDQALSRSPARCVEHVCRQVCHA